MSRSPANYPPTGTPYGDGYSEGWNDCRKLMRLESDALKARLLSIHSELIKHHDPEKAIYEAMKIIGKVV